MNLEEKIRTIPDWPKPGVLFRDITTLLQDKDAFRYVCNTFHQRYRNQHIDKIVAIDARGFIFGSVLAFQKTSGLVLVRKSGKLPADKISQAYSLEYGTNTLEIHADAITKGDKILLIDDLLATGGTAAAAITLIEKLGGEIIECAFVMELSALNGRQTLKKRAVFSLLTFSD